ncbi:RNA polymerase II subunit A domain phosphatase SSU72 [Colletotrichum higginsianum IMI 349063]|uniref:RNA polymerase II subunit A C-terminal domain phosphatase SSU72 n=3 Tax=Colletotrichum destructivum species complex TaxID=2707350 RepID=A0A1B7YDY9_COLHI|nr:RNA polymerase II subunit A domain phosphatase SSU72 [Colletotrichum higginsianum IMI 349063]OBR10287.1 RNA polymerase II subunit A domain phosphatase SSU72 [Colletotrichum higginsianum IMI 349063]TID06355.1 RNA polymerase II subunit A C-terminal domain phosphatase SSU72 [Colletotrichum higginsianum]WQF87452.1 Putative RNA polymerase II subunit A [Colletotrichum destructivum]GJD02701.1 RNA polymerase II subunit A domain phosphatase SSU72 [Colletotrichum higginsianum]
MDVANGTGTEQAMSTAAANSTTPSNGSESGAGDFKLKFCTVCASNQNRSMVSHLRLANANYPVISFGTGSLVRLPGPSITQPNVYHFNKTSYDSIFKELESKDPRLYRANGVLNMVDRNRHVKWGPERWQDWQVGMPRLTHTDDRGSAGVEGGVVDIVITCEERCWDAVIDDLMNRGAPLNRPVHVINVDIKDNHEEASVGGRAILDLANSLNAAAVEEREAVGAAAFDSGSASSRASFDERVPDILAAWQDRWPHLPAVWTLAWF